MLNKAIQDLNYHVKVHRAVEVSGANPNLCFEAGTHKTGQIEASTDLGCSLEDKKPIKPSIGVCNPYKNTIWRPGRDHGLH